MEELVIRSLQGQATPQEEARLLGWRRLDPANEARYRGLAAVWHLTGDADPVEGAPEKPSFDALMALARMGEAPAPPGGAGRAAAEAPRRPWRKGRGVAAALMAATVAGLAFVQIEDHFRPSPEQAGLLEGEIVTGAGELTTVTLADGTSIRLGPASRLRLRREGPDEVAELEGRAFFGVRSDAQRRFRVRTASGEAIVRGTRFEVRSEGDEFRVLVVDGRVQVAAAGAAVELGQSDMSHLVPGRTLTTYEVEDVYEELGWMGNSLVFHHTPLPRALEEIEQRLGLSVVLEDPELEDVTVTATFTDQTVEEVMLVLCGMLGTECIIADGRAVISSSPRPSAEPAV